MTSFERSVLVGIGLAMLAGLGGCKHELRRTGLSVGQPDGAVVDATEADTALPTDDAAVADLIAPVDLTAADTSTPDLGVDMTAIPDCAKGTHLCPGGCVSNDDPRTCGTACKPCDSPLDGTATCDGTQCGGACATGKKLCHGACVDADAACDGACPAAQHACGGLCPLTTDPNACGTSCVPCPVPAGASQAGCDGTKCDFQCMTGTHKCGAACAADGDAKACGSACTICPTDAHGTAVCVGGQCGIACKTGYHLCGTACVANTDVNSCGATSCAPCQAPVGGTVSCDGTACVPACPTGTKLCAGTCIAMAASCSGMCPTGTHDCSGLCAANTSVDSCGTSSCASCTKPTGASATTCDGTKCDFTCGAGYHRCGSTCASDTDATACGSMCVKCATDPNGTAACVAGGCSLACKSGFHLCNGKCVDNKAVATCGPTDNTSCNACTAPTGGGTVTCDGLACVPACPNGTKLCLGACIPMMNACNGMCPSGSHACGGICQSDTNASFCGASCTSCAAPSSNGSATCTSGSCGIMCNNNYKNCPGTTLCIPTAAGNCCTSADCTSGPANSTGTCTAANTCSYTCNAPAFKACGTTCIAAATCCGSCLTGYLCQAGQCPTSCTDHSQCATNYACRGGSCVPDVNVCNFKMPNSPGVGLPNPQSYDTTVAGVVTDKVTGLIWDKAIAPSTYTQAQGATFCAASRVDGRTDWRMPTVLELASLVNLVAANGSVAIDATVFPNTTISPTPNFITSTKVAANGNAWFVNFQNGNTVNTDTSGVGRVRCVRSPAQTCKLSRLRYTLQTSGGVTLVTDTTTGLIWRQDFASSRDWTGAENYCASLGAGYRQPTIKEFLTLVDFSSAAQPATDLLAFPTAPADYFWSSTPLSGVPTGAWLMDFIEGRSTWNGQSAQYLVRCVK